MPQGKGSIEDRKRKAIEAWVSNPLATYEEVAQKAGISDRTFYRYRQDEEFMNEYHKACQKCFSQLEAKAIEKLKAALDDSEWFAVKYILDGCGYAATNKVEINNNKIKVSIIDD